MRVTSTASHHSMRSPNLMGADVRVTLGFVGIAVNDDPIKHGGVVGHDPCLQGRWSRCQSDPTLARAAGSSSWPMEDDAPTERGGARRVSAGAARVMVAGTLAGVSERMNSSMTQDLLALCRAQ
jgi:hypothetical protein